MDGIVLAALYGDAYNKEKSPSSRVQHKTRDLHLFILKKNIILFPRESKSPTRDLKVRITDLRANVKEIGSTFRIVEELSGNRSKRIYHSDQCAISKPTDPQPQPRYAPNNCKTRTK